MTDPDTVHQWNQILGELARHYARLGPADRDCFVDRLLGRDEYECADPLPGPAGPARNELLLAIANGLAREHVVTISASPRRKGQGEFVAPGVSDLLLELA